MIPSPPVHDAPKLWRPLFRTKKRSIIRRTLNPYPVSPEWRPAILSAEVKRTPLLDRIGAQLTLPLPPRAS